METMEELIETYFEYMEHERHVQQEIRTFLSGKTVTIAHGRYEGRTATILDDFISVDYWGIHVHIGIHRRDGKPGYIDNHNASYVRLSQLEIK